MNTFKPAKTKRTQPKTPNEVQIRDLFRTPRYATRIILKYITRKMRTVWECASGEDSLISRSILQDGMGFHNVINTDIDKFNFVLDPLEKINWEYDVIVSNPPFSLKFDFIKRAVELDKPFAFLIPFDMSIFYWKIFRNDPSIQGIIPERRIDYLTPNILQRINDGIGIKYINKEFGTKFKSLEDIRKEENPQQNYLAIFENQKGRYGNIEEVPVSIVRRFSSSDFNSFWLVRKFNLEERFVFEPLSNEEKNIIF